MPREKGAPSHRDSGADCTTLVLATAENIQDHIADLLRRLGPRGIYFRQVPADEQLLVSFIDEGGGLLVFITAQPIIESWTSWGLD